MNLCDRCQQHPISEDGLCQVCYLIVVQDPRYRLTAGEQLEERLCHKRSVDRYDRLRQGRLAGGAR